jgi:hypothetical protein
MNLLDVFRERRPFPGQDPWIVPYEGALLLVQSAAGNRRIVVKRFHDLERMDRNVETVIWPEFGGLTMSEAGQLSREQRIWVVNGLPSSTM